MIGNFRGRLADALFLCTWLAAILCTLASALPAQTNHAAPKAEESALAREIRHQLQVLPYYSVFDYLSFRMEGNSVTLTGQVVRNQLQKDAEAAVRSIEGVTNVSNLIEVLPKSPADDDLRRGVYRAIYEDAELQRYAVTQFPAIHIIVADGTVTLEGSVENEGDKKLAASRAGGVRGVSSVANRIVIHSQGAPGK